MRCLLPLVALLGAAHAAPFFKLRFGPEHRTGPEGGVELPPEPFPQDVPDESAAVFALQLPKIDLSDIFRPLRVFAGVNVDHPTAIAVREEPNCDQRRFDLTEEEYSVVVDCEEVVGGDEVGLKECILTKLPKTSGDLIDFLDREEFGVAGLSSTFHLTLLNGEFTQKRSVQFRLCPRDEVNAIDGEVPVVQAEVPVVQAEVPVVQELVPIETLNPDRVDGIEPELAVSAPGAGAPPHRPLFQLPELKLPDFGQIFSQALAPVFGPPPPAEQGDAGLGLFGSHLNPFAIRHPPAAAGPQQGFFASLFPAIAGSPPPQGHPDGIDMNDCASKKFEVSRFVFNVANRCQYANDYRKCLRMDLADNGNATELLEFAADPSYSVVASSFSSFQSTFDLEALSSGKGLLDLKRKNLIDLRRCANIAREETTEEAAAVPEAATEVTEGAPAPTQSIAEVIAETVPEEIPIVLAESPLAPGAELVPEVVSELAPEAAPEADPYAAPEAAPEVATDVTTPEVFEATPEVPVEPASDAVEPNVEAKNVLTEAEKAVVDAASTVEAETATVEAETAAAEPEKAAVEAEKAAVEAEKAAVEAEKAAVEAEPELPKGSTQTSVYDVAEP